MSSTLGYGSWPSPISAADLAASAHAVAGGRYVGGHGGDTPEGQPGIWWLEQRPSEGGRYAVRRQGADGPVDVLPAPWNARTRVHEYGGGAWTVSEGTTDAQLYFTEFRDQRVYVLAAGTSEPRPLTPAGLGMRFAELQYRTGGTAASGAASGAGTGDGAAEIIAVRETHRVDAEDRELHGGVPVREIVAIPIDGSAAEDAGAIRRLVGPDNAPGDFLAGPRFSPDGRQLAWISWNHPNMPWDATSLRLGRLVDGVVAEWRELIGTAGTALAYPLDGPVSVLQPEWEADGALLATADQSGFWNLQRLRPTAGTDDAEPTSGPVAVHPAEADFAGPLWNLGTRWYAPLDDGRIIAVRRLGRDRLVLLENDGRLSAELDTPLVSRVEIQDVRGTRVLLSGTGATSPGGLWELDLAGVEEELDAEPSAEPRTVSPALRSIRSDVDTVPDAAWLPEAEEITVDGPSGPVHAFAYPPTNPEVEAPAGEHPPYLLLVHGGPTAHVAGEFSMIAAFFTSRGIGVLDVNYGGSTGYGRAYRERLKGQWGVVDVQDVIAAATGLADQGRADARRLAIRGGSAGGWTVLSALTSSDVFAAGISRYGVADLKALVEDTHDFEARYLDGLVGPLPEAEELYRERAPINRVDRLRTPVLLLQGLDDPVVPPSQSEAFRDAMLAAGIPHAYVEYPGESHGFRQAATIVHALESELSFLGQVLGFATPGVPELPLVG